jgi:DNA-binding FadR family transcriptional regulator
VSALRKADAIADDLLRRIVGGDLPVGSLLPKEAELAAGFGVNRSVVREAVKKLEVHRLVRPVRRRGTVVLDPHASLSPDVLKAMLLPREGRVDRAVFAALLEIRTQVDIHMVTLAAERRTPADLKRIAASVEVLEAARASPARFVAAAEDFVLAVALAAHNPVFTMLVHWHRHIFEGLEELFLLVRVPTDAHLAATRALLEGIRRKDVQRVRTITEKFHEWATPILLAAVGSGRERAPWLT